MNRVVMTVNHVSTTVSQAVHTVNQKKVVPRAQMDVGKASNAEKVPEADSVEPPVYVVAEHD